MSKILSVLVALFVIAVSVVYAMPSHRVAGGAGDIAMIECQDHECKIGCRTLHKLPTGVCTTPPFRHGESMKVICANAPTNALCYTVDIFTKNATNNNTASDCTDNNVKYTEYHQCDVCRPSHFNATMFQITTGCNSSATMTLKYDCDPACTQCRKTHQLSEKKCTTPAGFPDAIMIGAPARCTKPINYMHYNNSNCAGKAQQPPYPEYSNVCYSMMGRSHQYICS
jgi:hypothetical protein